MPRKQDWTPRHPARVRLTIEIVVEAGPDAPAVRPRALKTVVEHHIQHGILMDGLLDAAAGAGHDIEPVSWRVRSEGIE